MEEEIGKIVDQPKEKGTKEHLEEMLKKGKKIEKVTEKFAEKDNSLKLKSDMDEVEKAHDENSKSHESQSKKEFEEDATNNIMPQLTYLQQEEETYGNNPPIESRFLIE